MRVSFRPLLFFRWRSCGGIRLMRVERAGASELVHVRLPFPTDFEIAFRSGFGITDRFDSCAAESMQTREIVCIPRVLHPGPVDAFIGRRFSAGDEGFL